MIEICPKNECTGCGACCDSCSHLAIEMFPDQYGYFYPKIDSNKCVDCGLCQRVCPNNSVKLFFEPQTCWISASKTLSDEFTSASGGLSSILSRYVIKNNGVVYGCTMERPALAEHIRVDKIEDLPLLKGSKYVQSNTVGIFRQVRQDLRKKIIVLFVGTPCQISGLKSFLRKDYDNLITIDLVCHGVESQQILIDALHCEFPNININDYQLAFRRKNSKSIDYGLFLKKHGRIVHAHKFLHSLFTVGFLFGLFYRENCYNCKYAKSQRVGDITLGDFWDDKKEYKALAGSIGKSMVLINTTKGKELFEHCKDLLTIIPGQLEDFKQRNGQLQRPMKMHENRSLFLKLYISKGFKEAAETSLNKTIAHIKKGRVLSLIYSIPGTMFLVNLLKKII